jgi:two-component system phosphate regulon sensor histidine kinase PhoR
MPDVHDELSQREAAFESETLLLRIEALENRLESDPHIDAAGVAAALRDLRRSILRDATESRAVTSELEQRIGERTRRAVQASAQLESVVRELPVGVLIIDGAGELRLANRRAEELFSLSRKEIARCLRDDLWTVRDLEGRPVPKSERAWSRAMRTGEAIYDERIDLELEDGTRLITEGSVVPITAEDGAVAVVITFEDVTAREQRERAERNFVTNAAHELQTPIAAITSGIQVLQAGAKEHPADRDRFLAHIEAACARLDRLTRALLVLARAQAGQEPPRAELIEVEPLLRAVANALPPGAEIDITCPQDLAVIANKPLLEQALVNLGANAVKYTAGRVLLAAERENGRVRLEVRDEGLGIDHSERPRVFERFYRGVDDGDGFGLGLAIVAEAVRAIDGELELDSDEEGTDVSISLPAAHIRK